MVVKFDPRAKLPKALQQRLDQWDEDPPKRQFKAYGPLNAYLQGHKFPSSHYLVKPQKLLRKRAEHDDGDDDPDYVPCIDGDEADQEGNQETENALEQERDKDEEEDEGGLCIHEGGDGAGDISVDSIDSNGNAVSNKRPTYPDFTVERFWGADVDGSDEDVIGIVIEVASLTQLDHAVNGAKSAEAKERAKRDFQFSVIRQLSDYMHRSVKDDRILGIAVLGSDVALLEISSPDEAVRHLHNSAWISMFDKRFVAALNKSRTEMDEW